MKNRISIGATMAFILAWPMHSLAQETTSCAGVTVVKDTRANSAEGHTVDDHVNLADCEDAEEWTVTVAPTLTTNHWMHFYVGTDCQDSLYRNDSAHCTHLSSLDLESFDQSQSITFTIDMLVSGCGNAGENTYTLYALIFEQGNTNDVAECGSVAFSFDTVGTTAPSITDATSGDGRAHLNWENTESGSEDHQRFVFYCYDGGAAASTDGDADADADADTADDGDVGEDADVDADDDTIGDADLDGGADADLDGADADLDGDGDVVDGDAEEPDGGGGGGPWIPWAIDTSCAALSGLPEGSSYDTLIAYECGSATGETTLAASIDGLDNGQTYAIAMAAEDYAGNIGPSSAPVCVTPEETNDFFDQYVEAGGKAGFCFVATVAYGDASHPDVQLLRWFRDNVLRQAPGGSWVVGQYYSRGPGWAETVAHAPGAAPVVQASLSLFCDGIRVGRRVGLGGMLAGVMLLLGGCFWYRSRKSKS